MRRFAAVSLSLPLAVVACAKEPAEPGAKEPLETVEVGGGFDAGISLDEDVKGRPSEEFTAGVVPSDFPATFPIHQPSTVVGFGPGWVEFTTTTAAGSVESGLASRAQAAGWTKSGDGFTKEGRSARLTVGRDGGVTTIRVDYE